jgi:hypothetical protein
MMQQMIHGSVSNKSKDFVHKIETLSNIINKCEGEDLGWVKSSETTR